MAKLAIKKGSADVTVYLFAQDSSKTTGVGLTGLAYNTASLTAYYVRPLGSATQISLASLAAVDSAHTDGGFKEIDATNMPGVYRLDLPDAVCASGAPSAVVMLKGAANLAPVLLELQLLTNDPNDIATETTAAAVKAKTDNLPASPAAVGSAMTLTSAYDKAKDDVLTPLGVVDGIVDAIKAKTDTIPASPAQAGEYTAAIAAIPTTPLLAANYTAPDNASISAIKAKTDTIPASPAVAGEYTASIAAIQADLDNPNQYKADVSGIPDALLAKVIVDTLTLKQVLKVLAAIEIGTTTGGGTASFTYTGKDGTTVQLTGVDEDGNRTAVVVTPGA